MYTKVAFVKNNKDIHPGDKPLSFEDLVIILSNFIDKEIFGTDAVEYNKVMKFFS
jgi:hypothetical protein